MNIVTREKLMQMPQGTVWSYYEPCVYQGLFIKDDNPSDAPDFLCSDLIGAIDNNSSGDFIDKSERMENGESLPVDFEMTGREGMFDHLQLFAVYEKEDVAKLIERLQNANK